MKTLTKYQQRQIRKAHEAIDNAYHLIMSVSAGNDEFRYDGNFNILLNSTDRARSILSQIASELPD